MPGSGDTVAIAFTADVAQLQAGAAQASSVVAATTKEMGGAAGASAISFQRFTEILKEHRTHVRAESGLAKVLARDLASLGFEATGAGGAIAHMVSSLAVGGGIGAALAAVKIISEEFKLQAERTRALGELHEKVSEDIAAGWERIRLRIEGATAAQKAYDEESAKHSATVKAAKKELDEYEGGWKNLAYWFNVNDSWAEGLRGRIEALNRAMAAQRNQSDIMAALAQEQAKAAQGPAADKVIAADNERRRKAAEAEALRQAKMHDADVKARVERDLAAEQEEAEGRAKIQLAREKKEKELADAMRKAEIDADNAAFEKAYEAEQKALEKRQKAIEHFANRVGEVVAQALVSGKSPAEAMKAMLKEIEKELIQSAIRFITMKAAEAFAAAFVSQAAIPVVGPAEGAAQGAAAQSMILGLLGSLPSYAKGSYYIPYDQVAVLHQGERVDPAGSARGGGGGSANISVSVVDRRGLERVFGDSESEVRRALRRLKRSGGAP